MRALVIAALLFLTIAPAYAAGPNLDQKKDDGKLSAARQAEQDEAYKSSLKRIPAKEAVSDPWGGVRPGDGNPSSQGGSKKLQPANTAR
jgi:hypothetical protein